MGVPAFFRWLSEKYPKVLVPVHEQTSGSGPEEAGLCDNLYVDMNGVVHPCAHPEDRAAPNSEEEVYVDVMLYVDRLVAATRPTSLLYLAIDGVAPRAKMNQQRARRWKAAKEAAEKRAVEAETRAELTGKSVEDVMEDEWDSNVITPGTKFMHGLSEAVRKGVVKRQQSGDERWRRLAVIVSDASVAGEGEHKIMAFVRGLRTEPGYNPSTRHALHGLDADLIMLALATHEVDFSILREEVLFGRAAKQYEESAKAQRQAHAQLLAARVIGGPPAASREKSWIYTKPLQLLSIATLREYLAVEFGELARLPFFDFENVIDDFVFLCFFCGNDFLPHLPSLDIREGALDLLLGVYKAALPLMGGYVTSDGGRTRLDRLGALLQHVGTVEDEIFKRRRQSELNDRARQRQRAPVEPEKMMFGKDVKFTAEELDRSVKKRMAEKHSAKLDACSANFVDEIRLGEAGWKARYYGSPYVQRDVIMNGGLDALMREYVKGLDWVLRYYYAGCPSWGWYFPFHYAPFASDLAHFVNKQTLPSAPKGAHIDETLSADFELGKPFSPLEQLMAVLPSASAHAMPPKCRNLMLSKDSPIADFYTDDVDVDPNGKAMPWLHVVLLPFVDEKRLVEAVESVPKDDIDISFQTTHDAAMIFAHRDHPLAAKRLTQFVQDDPNALVIAGPVEPPAPDQDEVKLDARLTRYGIDRSDIASAALGPPPPRFHESKLLPGAVLPPRVLVDYHDLTPRPPPHLGRRGTPQVAELSRAAVIGMRPSVSGIPGRSSSSGGGGLNGPAFAKLQQNKRSWGSFEPQGPMKRARNHNLPHYSSTQQAQPPHPPPPPQRHTFGHPNSNDAFDNTASAQSIRAQLALALKRRDKTGGGGGGAAPPK